MFSKLGGWIVLVLRAGRIVEAALLLRYAGQQTLAPKGGRRVGAAGIVLDLLVQTRPARFCSWSGGTADGGACGWQAADQRLGI